MAGHGTWANIQHRTGTQDALRGRILAKRVRAMSEGARLVGGDPFGTPALHLTLQKSLIAYMSVAAATGASTVCRNARRDGLLDRR